MLKKVMGKFICLLSLAVMLLIMPVLAGADGDYQFVTQWGSQGSGNGQFNGPYGLAVDSSGNVYVTDYNNHRVQKFSSTGSYITKWGSYGSGNGQFDRPWGIAVDSSGNVYVVDYGNDRVQKFSSTGSYITKWGSSGYGNGQFDGPNGIAVDYSGNIYVVEAGDRIQKFSSSGSYMTQWVQTPGLEYQGIAIAVDSSGNVYALDNYNSRILKFSSALSYITQWGSYGSGNGQFNGPYGISVDSSGNVYVADYYNDRIQKLSSAGSYITKWGSSGSGNGQFAGPTGIAVDSSGNVYVVDYGNNRIQKFSTTQADWIYSNSIQLNCNVIKITDMSGSLSTSGAAITVKAWDINGNAIPESASAAPLKLYSHGTTTISASDLPARFPTALSYSFSVDSSKYIITNVLLSLDGTLNIPNGYARGTTKFVANSVGPRNSIKITDMSGSLSTSGAAITVAAWDVNGNALPESASAAPLKLYSHGTTTIAGPDLMARFPTGTPMSYEFTVGSSKYVITNVKSSADGSINIPYSYTSGTTNFVANSIGPRNQIGITDVSGSLSTSGAAITITAWDVNGNALPESASAAALKLYSHGSTEITGTALAARFPSGTPMSYEFAVGSSKYIITNVKSSSDGTITIPYVYTSGTTTYDSNIIRAQPQSYIVITDVSGSLSTSGAPITVAAWDFNGNAIPESASAAPLKLYSHGTTTIAGGNLWNRFPTGIPVLFEFTVGSSQHIISTVTMIFYAGHSMGIPNLYSSGVAGGI